MTPRDVLQQLRDGISPDPNAVRAFAQQLGTDAVSDAQAGAFAMGVCLHPLSPAAQVALTEGMRDSGRVMEWDVMELDVPGTVVDKHSTGGVGDAVSLLLAPMLAAVGAYVPMVSGRGLGHTGGTLDKLEAIPGMVTTLTEPAFRQIVRTVGCAIVAPTPDLAPADRRLYAVRDVTGTVRSLDLITASILSKKLAAGVGALVLDVKVGTGALMGDIGAARALAECLVRTANGAGCKTTALITDMNQPLIPAMGNALEVAAVMRGFEAGKGRLVDVALALGAEVLCHAGLYQGDDAARKALRARLTSGKAAEVFAAMVAAQGGPTDFTARWQDHLQIAPGSEVTALETGYVSAIDGTRLGRLVVALGGGRQVETDGIDHSVGLSGIVALGDKVQRGDPLAHIHTHDPTAVNQAITAVRRAITITDTPPPQGDLILDRIAP